MATDQQHRSRPAKGTKGTTDTTEGAGNVTTMTPGELQGAALAAIPGYAEIVAALAAVDDRTAQLFAAVPAPNDPTQLAEGLLHGEPLPDIGELGAVIRAREEQLASRHHEAQLVGNVHADLERRRQATLRAGSDHAFRWLGDRLHELVERAREVLSRLGTIRSAEQALDSEHPAEARDALRELRELATRHSTLREAQVFVADVVAAVDPNRHRLVAWSEQVALVARHGLVANPEAAGAPPEEPGARWLWLLDGPAVPAVPTYGELMRRADAARLASAPPRPTPPAPGPYLGAPGADVQRESRVRTRALDALTATAQ